MPFGHDCEFETFEQCVTSIMESGEDREAAESICGALKRDTEEECQNRGKSMSELTVSDILEVARQRKSRSGLITADRYFREVEGCFEGGFCPVKIGADSEGQWKKALKDAEKKLTYTNPDQKVITKSIKASKSEDFILEFDGVITTPRRDRDGDVLETKGAQIDKDMPLLMHHMGMMPIGKRLRTLRRNSDELKFKLGVVDTALARDNIPLIKAGALRISHGFDPIEFDLMDDERGFRFIKFLIFETSLVSIPSNVDAVITNFSEKSFETTLMKGWYDGMRRKLGNRKKSVATVPDDIIDEEEDEEGWDASAWSLERNEVRSFQETSAEEVGEQETPEDQPENSPESKESETKEYSDPEAEEKEWLKKYEEWVKSEDKPFGAKPPWEFPSEVIRDGTTWVPKDAYLRAIHTYKRANEELANPPQRSFSDIEQEYIAELAKANTDTLRKAQRQVSLMLKAAEDQEAAREWDEVLSLLT